MVVIFLDESGYTGADFLNPRQPVFVIASLNLDEPACKALKERFFGEIQARELKHSVLCRRPNQQRMVVEFLDYLKRQPQIFKIAVAHKQFALVCKVVDLVLEPAANETGLDIYDRGFNIAFSNLLFYVLPSLGGNDFFSDFLSRFQIMVRHRTYSAYNKFFELVFKEYEHDSLNELLGFLQVPHYILGHRLLDMIPDDTLDLGFTFALTIMAKWRAGTTDAIRIIHDVSATMSKQRHIWDALMDPNLRPVEVGYDRRKMVYPISVERTDFQPSEEWAGLQLADILAGAIARQARWLSEGNNECDTYANEIWSVMQEVTVFPLWPEPKFTPEELGTTGPNAMSHIDYHIEIMDRKRPSSNDLWLPS